MNIIVSDYLVGLADNDLSIFRGLFSTLGYEVGKIIIKPFKDNGNGSFYTVNGQALDVVVVCAADDINKKWLVWRSKNAGQEEATWKIVRRKETKRR